MWSPTSLATVMGGGSWPGSTDTLKGKVARRRIREAHDSAGQARVLRLVQEDGA